MMRQFGVLNFKFFLLKSEVLRIKDWNVVGFTVPSYKDKYVFIKLKPEMKTSRLKWLNYYFVSQSLPRINKIDK